MWTQPEQPRHTGITFRELADSDGKGAGMPVRGAVDVDDVPDGDDAVFVGVVAQGRYIATESVAHVVAEILMQGGSKCALIPDLAPIGYQRAL
jgi:hypothetical protein